MSGGLSLGGGGGGSMSTGTLNRQVHFERLVRLSLDVSFDLPNDSIDL